MSKPENTRFKLTPQLKEEIETLFSLSPPRNMKKSLMEVYTVYLQHLDNMDFKEVAADIYFLNKLLERMDHPPNPLH